jgi:hypothetical protein
MELEAEIGGGHEDSLALWILAQALVDALRGDVECQGWLFSYEARFWATVAGCENWPPRIIVERFGKARFK